MHTFANASERMTDTGWGIGVWGAVAEANEKLGSGSRQGVAKGAEESWKTDEPEGVDRKVWGVQHGAEVPS